MPNMKEKIFIGSFILFAVAVLVVSENKPTFEFSYENVTAEEGSNVDMECSAHGDQPITYEWNQNEDQFDNNSYVYIFNYGNASSIYSIQNVTPRLAGFYTCTASNRHGLSSKTFELRVVPSTISEGKPTFEFSYENVTAEEGSNVEMECSAHGDQPITYEWNQNEDQFDNNSWAYIYYPGNASSVYAIQNVTPRLAGFYTCTASNRHGLSNKTFELRVVPSTKNETDNGTSYISNIEIANITSTSVLFSIEIVGSARRIEVQYIETRERNTYNKQIYKGDVYEIEGLIPGGLYDFRFRLAHSNFSEWSRELNVTLLPAKPDVILYNIQGGNLEIGWSRKFDDIMRKTIDRYELSYYSLQMEGGNYWIPSNCPITVQIPSCAMSRYTISGLSRNVFYEVQLKAHTESGYGEPFTQKLFFEQRYVTNNELI